MVNNIHGNNNMIGGTGNVMNVGVPAAETPVRPRAGRGGRAGGPPVSSLYAYADIVGYSRFNARLQERSQAWLADILDAGLHESGVDPELAEAQDQGDARLLKFPAETDIGRVLAVLPRHLNGELAARNEDMAPHAHLRVRLAFAMGISVQGRSGLVGNAPIAVVRLANADVFRRAMRAEPPPASGVIVDDYLYSEYVRQDFRWDMNAAEYLKIVVEDEAKGFAAQAWLRLPGFPPRHLAALLA